ncbi:unnamed protein product, partial [Ectocarpus sp. 12 AP-2014]
GELFQRESGYSRDALLLSNPRRRPRVSSSSSRSSSATTTTTRRGGHGGQLRDLPEQSGGSLRRHRVPGAGDDGDAHSWTRLLHGLSHGSRARHHGSRCKRRTAS